MKKLLLIPLLLIAGVVTASAHCGTCGTGEAHAAPAAKCDKSAKCDKDAAKCDKSAKCDKDAAKCDKKAAAKKSCCPMS